MSRIAAIDIGSNSTRLLLAEPTSDGVRWLERRTIVTGLGRGAGPDGRLAPEAIARTVAALAALRTAAERAGVEHLAVIATAAARRAPNRRLLLDGAARVLGVRPQVISGDEEAALAFAGARTGLGRAGTPLLVVDIGGGSTELVWGTDRPALRVSLELGSVRLTEEVMPQRPAPEAELAAARNAAAGLLAAVEPPGPAATVVGVAGTFTSLAAISQDLPAYDPGRVHASVLSTVRLAELVLYLAGLSIAETAALPSLDPGRAPVILAGAVIAEAVLRRVGAGEVVVSEADTLDGLVLKASAAA